LDDGVNAFLFGGKFSIGYGGVNLFIKKDLTPIFDDKALLPNKNGIQIGIELANIDF
jgi:CRISPR/Cas system CSM-associated protein Csm4 (group 5 of RAMP superfamily)